MVPFSVHQRTGARIPSVNVTISLFYETAAFLRSWLYNRLDTSPIVHDYDYKKEPRCSCDLGLEFLAEHGLRGVSVFSELLDTLVEFIE